MLMPDVQKCTVNNCFYWMNDICKANAIQVGDDHPMCDTFARSMEHKGPADHGKVGACHTSNCEYNQQLSCSAMGIEVGFHSDHADCLTFEPK
ncbi:MAG: DUF1540 domain-containing protein [Armatimonadota bacterium]